MINRYNLRGSNARSGPSEINVFASEAFFVFFVFFGGGGGGAWGGDDAR